MVNVGSLSGSAQVSFDFETQVGVTQLLAAIRASELTTSEKNELRDLVFLYANGGKDQTVRRALEQKIASYGLVPPPPKVTEQPLPPPPLIGKYRAAPTYSVLHTAPTTAPAISKPSFSVDPAWNTKDQKPEPQVAESISTAAPSPEPITSTPEPTPSEPVVSREPEITPAPPTPVPVATAAPALNLGDNDSYLARIREIKAMVNEKVGNPVNLVDINNEVGREYMGALLDAMKKLNSGSSAASAMKRLEESYVAVEKTLEGRDGGLKKAPIPTPVQNMPVLPELVEEPAYQAPISAPVFPVSYPNTTPVTAEEIPESAPAYEPTNIIPVIKAPVFDAAVYRPEPSSVPEPMPSVQVVPAVPAGRPAPPPPRPETYFSSLADYGEKPQPAAAQTNTPSMPIKAGAGPGDPLFSPEVDDGLQQLLSEWSIYKKSGLFGTGPKGKEHPLFKKMAPLQIPLLLAGRFDGATQEIKQSVTDYMNGWRYEQGLIYQQSETFEHYLRRVIRHILDLQK